MDREEVKNRVLSVVCSTAGWLKDEDIGEDYSFQNDLGIDSLEFIEFIISLEKEFNITISDDYSEAMYDATVGDVIDLVCEMVK